MRWIVHQQEAIPPLRWIVHVWLILLLLVSATPISAEAPPRVLLNDTELALPPEQQPFIDGGRTLVPMRAIFEALGAELEWDESTRAVTARGAGVLVKLWIDSDLAKANHRDVRLEQPARLRNNRTYVPLRFVAESFGAVVAWDGESRTVRIQTGGQGGGQNGAGTPGGTPGGTPDGTQTGGAFDPAPLTRAAADALTRVAYAPGAAIDLPGAGLFFIKVADGDVEGWLLQEPPGEVVGYSPSPDNRYAMVRTETSGYLADRSTGATRRWDRSQMELVAAAGARLVFAATRPAELPSRWFDPVIGPGGHIRTTGRFAITDPDLRIVAAFTLPAGAADPPTEALLSPDGTQVAVSSGGALYLVDTATGQFRRLGAGGRLGYATAGRELAVRPQSPAGGLRTYDWTGEQRVDLPNSGKLSPDGQWLARTVFLDRFTPAVIIEDARTGTPRTRVLGADLCYGYGTYGGRWLAGSSGLLMQTRQGLRMLAGDQITPIHPEIGKPGEHSQPMSAPDGSGRVFNRIYVAETGAERLEVLEASGGVRARVLLGRSASGLAPNRALEPWGLNTDEARFAIHTPVSGGLYCGDFTIPAAPKVESPPFSESLTLQVTGTGDCLNLRGGYSLASPALACLPDGTRLTVHGPEDLDLNNRWGDNHQWVHVRTDTGQQGWVSLTSGNVHWAEAP